MARRSLFKATSFAAILILAAGCSDLAPTAPQLESTSIAEARGGQAHLKVQGKRVNVVKSKHKAGVYMATINKHGGTIDFGIGTIHFPAGALTRGYRISAVTAGSDLGAVFGPSGLKFNKGVTICFKNAKAVANEDDQLAVVNDDGVALEWLSTEWKGDDLCGITTHFSRFVVGSPN